MLMDWDILKEISIDFLDSKYISVNAKQFDRSGRSIKITCKNDGKIIRIDKNSMYAFVRYRRTDGRGMIQACPIDDNGKILMKLTKRMLDIAGKCYADIILIESDTPRSPVAENGFFVAEYIYDEENERLETLFTPEINSNYSDERLFLSSVNVDGKNINICVNPAPFVVGDKNGTVTVAMIDENGEMLLNSKSVSSTMTFCVNVIDSSFYGKCEEIMR